MLPQPRDSGKKMLPIKMKKKKFYVFMWAEGFSTEQREGREESSVKHCLKSLFRKVCKYSCGFIQSKIKPFLFYRSCCVAWELRDHINTWIGDIFQRSECDKSRKNGTRATENLHKHTRKWCEDTTGFSWQEQETLLRDPSCWERLLQSKTRSWRVGNWSW